MKKRLPVVAGMALLIAALVFFARRPKIPKEDFQPPVNEVVAETNAPRPDLGERMGTGTSVKPGSPVLSTKSADLGATASAPPRSAVNPESPITPVIVGSRTFVPKVPPPSTDPQGEVELGKVRTMLRDYRTLFRENPVGTNADIMKAVMGENPKQARLGPPEGQTLSADGELLDQWGTPYFFHQLSGESMEVRSAGPDKTLWTSDDIVTK
jgi:hypothetical protein